MNGWKHWLYRYMAIGVVLLIVLIGMGTIAIVAEDQAPPTLVPKPPSEVVRVFTDGTTITSEATVLTIRSKLGWLLARISKDEVTGVQYRCFPVATTDGNMRTYTVLSILGFNELSFEVEKGQAEDIVMFLAREAGL